MTDPITCTNCGAPLAGRFCSNCGTPAPGVAPTRPPTAPAAPAPPSAPIAPVVSPPPTVPAASPPPTVPAAPVASPPPTVPAAPVAADPGRLFPWQAGRGWWPLLALCVLSATTVAPLVVVLLHRPELRLDLAVSATGLDQALAVGVGGLVLAAAVGGLAGRAVDAAWAVRAGAVVSGAAFLVLGGVNDPDWLGVLLFVGIVFCGLPLTLARASALDVYGSPGAWRVSAAVWAGAGAGVAVIGFVEWVWPSPDWGLELAGLGAVAVAASGWVPRPTGTEARPVATARRGAEARASVGPVVAVAAAAGLAMVATAPTAVDLLTTKWDLARSSIGGLVLLGGIGVAAFCGFGHWYHHLAVRSGTHLTGVVGAAGLTAAVTMAAGAASITLIGVLLAWTVAAGAGALAATAAEAAAGAAGPSATRHWRSGAFLAAAGIGSLFIAAGPDLVDVVSRGWLITLAAVPLAVLSGLVLLRFPADETATEARPGDARTTLPPESVVLAAPTNGSGHAAVEPVPLLPPAPVLRLESIDAGYDGVQVLFGVDLEVQAGQIVALMGTNGAGKSTTLRVTSGLLAPTAGTVSFCGVDVTDLDPTWRVNLGMGQIAGGESLAPGLSVAENLRMFAHTLGGRGQAVDAGIDAALDHFPRLAERRNQPASTLSGGEKQMLALAKAFVTRPRLLVIDEFSLGLAPLIVGELLPVISELNAGGMSILLVEQSVNVALSVAHHAYAMEKGEIVFDGPAARLRDEPGLLQAVYLEGISKAVAS